MAFRIRNEQVQAFARRLEADFAERTADRLRDEFPAEVERSGLDHDGLKQLALRGVADARGFDVINEDDVGRYVECMLILGPEFPDDPQFPWAGQILKTADLDGEAKMDQIDEYLIFDLRVGAEP